MAYTEAFRNRVKQAYVSGKFRSVTELCEHFGIPRQATVWKWARDGNWRAVQKAINTKRLEGTKRRMLDSADHVEKACLEMWSKLEQAISLWTDAGDVSPDALEKITRAAERVHKGLRLAIGLPESVSQEIVTGKPVEELSEEELQRELERVTEHISQAVTPRVTPTANAPPATEARTLKTASG